MKVTKFPNKLGRNKHIMILGSFSSFHNGHKTLLDVANTYNKPVIICLIENPDKLPSKKKNIYESFEIRLQQISNLGIYGAVVVHFNKEIMNLDGKDFATKIKKLYNVEKFIIGKDFAMGKNASYKALDIQKDFPTIIVKIKKINNQKIATKSLIEMVNLGEMELIKQLSPFAFTISTKIKKDNTFEITDCSLPHTGIYAVWAIVNDIKYWAIARISHFSQNELIIPDLLIQDSEYQVYIEFRFQIRTIIKQELDLITKDDKKNVVQFLKNNL